MRQFMSSIKYATLLLKTACIDVYGLKGEIDKGEALFDSLRTSEMVLDPVAYNVLLTMYLRGNLLQKAEEVLELIMKDENLRHDSYLFHVKCGLAKNSVDVYWRIVGVNIIRMNHVVGGCCHYKRS